MNRCVKARQQRNFGEPRAEILMAFLNGSVEVEEVVTIFLVMAADEILMKVLVEEGIEETKFSFSQIIFSFIALLVFFKIVFFKIVFFKIVFFKECLFRLMKVEEEANHNFEGLIGGLGIRKKPH